ncbi:MarR family winged helix-turn-helix transcriptional regulator [Cuniculiplasma divulgatum]|jgi:DNA-binding MarR family transcriptional regulator|uniref:MarR family transcriptional regulator n=1 Tax=Cuniculiplasma divulgatum TaxID=1673428 RepID=A0A1N5VKW3_9ARCH|nr:MarR family transcriptional regulator [Cuniculiplasma divulgatum]WMT49556.1 MAG: MarR family transcriptional regulator [Thermoplasmatales archaeon]SIM73572.1 MarR family transcriptional regulator [Cuniculiplasma divulgatum]SJK85214.1 MarR family transcriptional regulator [Cuniculiplasma divulgatum]
MSEKREPIEVWRAMVETWKVWKKGVEKNLERINLGSTEYSILRYLTEEGNMPMVQMANNIMVTQGWITGLIDSMEKRNLVERTRSKDDRRVIELNITKEGSKVFERAKKVHLEYIANCIKHMDDETVSSTVKLLKDLRSNIEDAEMPEIKNE